MEIFPGTFENLAKMARMTGLPSAKSNSTPRNSTEKHVPVRLRSIHSPPVAMTTTSVQNRKPYTDSDTDSTPRPTSHRSYPARSRPQTAHRLFYREPFPEGPPPVPEPAPEEETVEDKVSLERWRNKQWQRQKMQAVRSEGYDPRKEKRRRVFTRRERDQMRAKQFMYGDMAPVAVMSDIENRFPDEDRFSDRWHRSLSGYSTPASSCDEMKLGRNMRAVPRHIVESRHRCVPKMRHKPRSQSEQPLLPVSSNQSEDVVVRYYHTTHNPLLSSFRSNVADCDGTIGNVYSPQHPTQDLIEMLNRQQQLLQLQQDQRKKFLEDQKVREQAKILVNEALLTEEEKSRMSHREGSTTSLNKLGSEQQLGHSGASTPAIEQLITQGRISSTHSVTSVPSKKSEGDFFENDRFDGPGLFDNNNSHDATQNETKDDGEKNEQLTQAIRDELNRLKAS